MHLPRATLSRGAIRAIFPRHNLDYIISVSGAHWDRCARRCSEVTFVTALRSTASSFEDFCPHNLAVNIVKLYI
jgi:hypothetical protein